MKRTYIAAILIAITANSASAQQTFSVPYQAAGPWPASGQYYPVSQVQTVVQPIVPVVAAPVLSTPAIATSVLQRSVGQQTQLQSSQAAAASRAPAPAPSIPPQPEGLIVPATSVVLTQPKLGTQPQPPQVAAASRAPAPAPSIPPQPEGLIVPAPTAVAVQSVQETEAEGLKTSKPQELAVVDQAVVPGALSAPALSQLETAASENKVAPVTPSLMGQLDPVRPVEESVLKTPEIQEEIVAVENVEPIVEPTREPVSPLETATAVVANPGKVESAIEGQSGDFTDEIVSVPELGGETAPVKSDFEDSIAPAADVDIANIDPTEGSGEEVTEPAELAMSEIDVAEQAESKLTESRTFDSSSEADSGEPVEIAAAPSSVAEDTASVVVQPNVAPLVSTAPKNLRRTTSYGKWLWVIPTIAIPVVGWLYWRKRRQITEVNSFANEALSRLNSKSSSSKPVAERPSPGERLATIARGVSKEPVADSPSLIRSRLDEVVKGVGQKKTAAIATPDAKRKEVATSEDDFSSCDQFCCIRGIDLTTQETLHKAGFVRFSDLKNATQSELAIALSGNDHQFSSSDFSRWSSLSSLAGKGDWAGFEKLQASFAAPEVSESTIEQPTAVSAVAGDDLTQVRGIGPATAELLKDAGIITFEALADVGTVRLQEILDAGGTKFEAIDPSLWCRQAQFQISGTWTRPTAGTVAMEFVSGDEAESISPNVTVTTPEYRAIEPTRTIEPTVEVSVADGQAPASPSADSHTSMSKEVGVLSKEEVERLEQLADTPSKLNDESALLDQINAIREIAARSIEGNASEEAVSAADASKASAK